METAEKRPLSRRKQILPREEDDLCLLKNLMKTGRSGKDFDGCSKVLHGLFKGVILSPDLSGSDGEEAEERVVHPRLDSQQLFTETDVTLPSCLNGSLGSRQTDREIDRAQRLSHFCSSSSSGAAKILQEMETVYEQLKTERQNQLEWEKKLQERETRLKQQEEALQRLENLEEILHSNILTAEEKHKQEILHLQNLLREKTKENKRLKSSFETLKDMNDNMKKQLNELSEQNKRLENQSRRVQARLENLQRKYELGVALRGCISLCKAASLLLDWVFDAQLNSSKVPGVKDLGHSLPPEILLNERCLKVLPLLADQLSHTSLSEPALVCSLLRLIHGALRHLDNSAQHVALSATLRRIGEEVSKPRRHLQFEDPETEEVNEPKQALYRNPCPETRLLSVLIILRTVSQGYLKYFMEACSCDDFFHTASQVLRSPHLELSLLEKLCILLQKLSSIRKNRRLFESSSLLQQIKDLHCRYGPTHTFLCLNLTSILHNLQ
ncbi:hypothetical protein WMY93_002937 [Mugilogobius chulae]|uniref:Coiled-coil domain-containing protein 138 n=1 Tax=Mugilogobius chulae TaxID=88201 RepID=A0AAW0PV42_9GOBI